MALPSSSRAVPSLSLTDDRGTTLSSASNLTLADRFRHIYRPKGGDDGTVYRKEGDVVGKVV